MLFLVNKSDSEGFLGVDHVAQEANLSNVECYESIVVGGSSLEMKGIDEALKWVYNAVSERAPALEAPCFPEETG